MNVGDYLAKARADLAEKLKGMDERNLIYALNYSQMRQVEDFHAMISFRGRTNVMRIPIIRMLKKYIIDPEVIIEGTQYDMMALQLATWINSLSE